MKPSVQYRWMLTSRASRNLIEEFEFKFKFVINNLIIIKVIVLYAMLSFIFDHVSHTLTPITSAICTVTGVFLCKKYIFIP